MKKIFIISAMSFLYIAHAQVGIDTTEPKATLDVMANTTETSKADGIIAPRLTGAELKTKDAAYEAPQTGAMVYITEALPAVDVSTKTEKVTEVGYYYFDGTLWQPYYKEPWNVFASETKATNINEMIYHKSNVVVGSDKIYGLPGKMNVVTKTSELQANEPGKANLALYALNEENNKKALNYGIHNQFRDKSNDTNGTIGIESIVQDFSATSKSVTGLNLTTSAFGNKSGENKSATSANMSLLLSDINNENFNFDYDEVNGVKSEVRLGGTSFNLQEHGSAIHGIMSLTSNDFEAKLVDRNGNSGLFLAAGRFESDFNPGNSNPSEISSPHLYGVDAIVNINIASGSNNNSATLTDLAALHTDSRIIFDNAGSTLSIDNLYGIHIDNTKSVAGGSPSINNAYGLYIKDFSFDYSSTAGAKTSYNIYSEGSSSQNLFEGKVGIGATVSNLTPLVIENLPVYDDNTAASALPNGGLYRTSTGVLMVKY